MYFEGQRESNGGGTEEEETKRRENIQREERERDSQEGSVLPAWSPPQSTNLLHIEAKQLSEGFISQAVRS